MTKSTRSLTERNFQKDKFPSSTRRYDGRRMARLDKTSFENRLLRLVVSLDYKIGGCCVTVTRRVLDVASGV